jgi:hypothetical protein
LRADRLRLPTALALLLLAALAFVNATDGEFVYDDFPYVVENPQVQNPTLHRVLLEPLSGRAELGLHRPLPVLTYAAQARGRGAEAPTWPFHLFNIATHALVVLLVWQLLLRIGAGEAVAAIAAALFAVHPCHLEAVDWIVGRAELLAALFGLAFLVVALRGGESSEVAGVAPPRRPRDTWLAALLLALAGLSKESAFALPGVLIVVELALGRVRPLREVVRRHWPWAIVLLLLAALRVFVLSRFEPTVELHFGPRSSLAPYAHLNWLERPLLALNLFGEYVWRALVPVAPRAFFHRSEFTTFRLTSAIGLLAYAAALVVAWRRSSSRPLRAALLALPVTLATVLNLVPIQETLAERFLYLPSAFVLVVPAALFAALVDRERARSGRVGLTLLAPAAAIVALLACAWIWNPVWHDALALWRHNVAQSRGVVDATTDLPYPHYQFAYFLHQKHVYTARDAETPGAIDEYEAALAANERLLARGLEGMPPDQRIRSHVSLGEIWIDELPLGRRDPLRAKPHVEEAMRIGVSLNGLDAELAKAYWLHAQLAFLDVGVTLDQAVAALESALRLQLSPEQLDQIRRELDHVRQAQAEREKSKKPN